MSKKTIRSSFWLVCASAFCAWTPFGGCASKSDGDGSETHFLCSADSDCTTLGTSFRCIEKKCTKPATNDARSEAQTCPPSPHYYPHDGGPPEVPPPGFVDAGIYGCYPPRELAPSGWMPAGPRTPCQGTLWSCTYAPTALPCGACSNPGEVCGVGVAAVCDCGAGPFVDVYDDEWGCKCVDGQWDCRLVGASGASCTICGDACLNETRSTPYTPGMVVAGQAGVTVALTSNPAPPALGDNAWTFMVNDPGGAPVSGATITVTQVMVDHGHGGAKTVVVTDLGGGRYRAAPVNFNMVGYWETTLLVKKAPLDDEVVIKLCVQ